MIKRVSFSALALTAVLWLTACGPVTDYPQPNILEIKSEAALQKQLVRGNLTAMEQTQLGRAAGNPDQRLQRIALRILTSAAPLCGINVQPQISIDITPDPISYPEIIGVIPPPLYTLTGREQASDAPDILAGDRLTRIGKENVEVGHGGYRKALDVLLDLEDEGEPTSVAILRKDKMLNRRIQNYPRCTYGVESIPRAKYPNAFADGEKIQVTTSMVRLMPTDDELAFILGHELGHNLLGHANKAKVATQLGYFLGTAEDLVLGWPRDEFAQLGSYTGSRIYSKSQEMEADYLGVYLMASAGYDPDAALLAMRRLGFQEPLQIDARGDTHPSTALRAAAIKNTIEEVKYKIRRRELLLPKIKDNMIFYDYDYPGQNKNGSDYYKN